MGDNIDAFANDSTEWLDSDEDGCGDNADVWPYDASECFDTDFDGVGDNADAFPDSAFEWLDSDGDGLGDNTDLFPFDKDAKYDSDGDGVADSYDWFPQQSGMDSLFDLGWRIALGLTLIGLLVLFIQRASKPEDDGYGKEWMQQQEEDGRDALENRPASAPTFDEFN